MFVFGSLVLFVYLNGCENIVWIKFVFKHPKFFLLARKFHKVLVRTYFIVLQ